VNGARERLEATCPRAVVDGCSKDGCSLDIGCFVPRPLVIDTDQLERCGGGNIPDYYVLVTDEGSMLAVVELKSGRLDASLAADQLQGGAYETEGMLTGIDVEFFPIVLCGRGVHAAETKVLGARKIRFRGVSHPIIKKRCASRLRDILNEFR
jgi:hypothetical protein